MNNQLEILRKSSTNLNINIENAISDSTKRIENITNATSKQIKIMAEDMEKIFTRKIDKLDEVLEIELTKSLSSLGNQLATISERFASDYTPLADKLREVVELSKGV